MNELTPRECSVLTCMAYGLTTKLGARFLGMNHETYRTHVQTILVKLGTHTAAGAVGIGYRTGLLETDKDYSERVADREGARAAECRRE